MLKLFVLGLVLQTVIGSPVEERPFDFSQYKLIRILPNNSPQLERLEELGSHFDSRIEYWNPPMNDMRPVLCLVSPDGMEILTALNQSNIKYEVQTHNFQKMIDRERQQNEMNKAKAAALAKAKGMERAFDYNTVYHTYQEIVDELKSLGSSSAKATYLKVGTTYQGREIPGIIVTNQGGSNKQSIILECGIHSREWVTTASCLWMTNELLTNSALNSYLDKYEFIIVPTLNSDGYVYTWTSNRMWRKTRTVNGLCYGADPNRNWDANHCGSGASTNACSDTYCGKAPFSEPCVKAMADLITSRRGKVAAYFAIHSYSQLWMYPYGYKSANPANAAALSALSAKAVAAIKGAKGKSFTYGTIASTIYVASGSSIDWAYDSEGVKIAFALELRDTGTYGFQLPPDQILDGSIETWAGIKATIDGL